METPIKMDDLGVPLFSETSISPKMKGPWKLFFRMSNMDNAETPPLSVHHAFERYTMYLSSEPGFC